MTTGLKIWLWIVLVLNTLACIGAVLTAFLLPAAWVTVILELLTVVGTAMLLFARKKMGFYVICGSNVLGMIANLFMGVNVVFAVFSVVLMPLIIWLLMKNTWYEFQ